MKDLYFNWHLSSPPPPSSRGFLVQLRPGLYIGPVLARAVIWRCDARVFPGPGEAHKAMNGHPWTGGYSVVPVTR